MSRLKTELSWLRRRGAVRTDEEDGAVWRACGRCRAELGLIINRGAPCRACRQRVCKQCREFGVNGRDWVCTVCHKHIEIQLASGEWMNEFVRRPSRRREHKVYVPPADVVKRSLIKRSWTISRSDLREDGTRKKRSFPCPAGVERTSPELRVLGCRPTDAPHKPPRGHRQPTDENEPPWDALHYPSQGAPPRRYSMSSVDGVAPSSRHVKGPAPLPPRGGPFQESQGYHSPHLLQQQPSLDSPPLAQRRRLLPDLPQQPTRLPPAKPERPSTLPRKLRQLKDTSDQTHLSPPLAHDADRFHSMPRTRARSPGGPGRGHSDPSRRSRSPVVPLRENVSLGGYISSGPVTSTPIMHDPSIGPHRLNTSQPTPAPRDLSRPPASGRPPEQNIPTSQMRHHTQTPPQGVTRIIEIEVERDDGPDTSGRGPASRTNSGMSTSSRGTPNSSDQDGEANVFSKLSSSRPHQAVSPSTSLQHQASPSPTYRPHQAVSPPISHQHQAASPSASHLRPTTSPPLQHPRQAASPPASHPRQAMSPAAQHPRQPSSSPITPPRQPSMSPVTHPRLATNTTRLISDESTGCAEEGVGLGHKSGSPSPLVGSVGRISGRDSIASLASSTDTSCLTHPDDDIERLLQLSEKKTSSLTPLGSRSESMASVCSAGAEGRYGTVTIKGEIELGLQYNYKEGQLECRVVQCRDLAAVDNKRNRSDPYVKVYLLPDKSKSGKRKTKVKKHTLNPVFEEVLRFSTTMSELDSRTLWVSVWHSDMFGRNDFLGEVIISLTDTVFDDVTPRWYPLQDRMEPMEDLSYSPRGDLILALKFVPPDAVSTKKSRRSRGALHVLVKEAKSLAAARPHGTADPICKGLLLPEKGKASKQKTSVCRKTLNPTWNHTLVFEDTSLQELTERALELSVWDHDRLGPSQFLGGCRLNLGKGKHGGRPVEWMEAAGMEVKLWEQMLERPNLWVEGSIMLRPAMDKPIYSSSMTE
ncbi:uncharacterized protein [Panulirus ornatus]|uniref:uncharacterized protein isoform X4 n=1 Tax=Panulirus ornatus TaxID=150431 RepID=UPI003A882987